MEQKNKELNKESSKQKFFIVFKLIKSILYFISSIIGVILFLSIMMISYMASNGLDNSGDIYIMAVIGALSIISVILCSVVLVITIISTVKFFKNKYSKVMDMLIAIIFLPLDIALLGVAFYTGSIIRGIIALISGGVMLYNIIYLICKKD